MEATSNTVVKKKLTRYSPEKRKELLTQYTKLRKKGMTAADAANQLAVPYITLRTWEKKGTPKRGKGSKVSKKVGRKKAAKRGRPKTAKTRKSKKRFKGRVRITFPDGTVVACETPADAATVLSAV